MKTLTVAVLALGISGDALIAAPAWRQGSAPPGITRTVFASVLTKDGQPVTGLTAADFEVKEAGKIQSLTSVTPLTRPLRIHVIVSDAGSGALQLGVLRLAQALADRAEFAFSAVTVQSERVLDYTRDVAAIGAGLQKLGRRGAARGAGQLMEAIDGALRDLGAPGKRSVLIVLRVGGEEASTLSASRIREALRTSGAALYVVSRSGASKAAPTYAGGNSMSAEAAQREMDNTELADTALNLNLVLGDGSRESGGSHVETPLTSAVPTLEQLANEIKNQYELTYTLPAGTKLSDRLQITTKRKDVVVHAAQKIPN